MHLCVPFDVLLPVDSLILRFFSIQCCLALSHLDFELWFLICTPESCTARLLLAQIRIHEACSLATPLAQCFNSFGKIQPVLVHGWPKQTSPHLVSSILFKIRFCLPSNQTCVVLDLAPSNQACVVSCNLRPGVILVFLHFRYHTLIWIVEQQCVVFTCTQCHIRLSEFGVVFDTLRSALPMS